MKNTVFNRNEWLRQYLLFQRCSDQSPSLKHQSVRLTAWCGAQTVEFSKRGIYTKRVKTQNKNNDSRRVWFTGKSGGEVLVHLYQIMPCNLHHVTQTCVVHFAWMSHCRVLWLWMSGLGQSLGLHSVAALCGVKPLGSAVPIIHNRLFCCLPRWNCNFTKTYSAVRNTR